MHATYTEDRIKALDAKYEAQRLAFAPVAFQAARALRNLGILAAVAESGDKGVTSRKIAEKLGLSEYGVGVLLEMGLSMGLVKLVSETEDSLSFVLGKIGYFVLEDAMTRANMDFVHDVCYQGLFSLEDAVREGSPAGLKVFGEWPTIYEGLSRLPEAVRHSWFAFDHYYSDIAFPDALPIVFGRKPRHLFDIGGNTAKWAISCCRFDPAVQVSIIDLPGQLRDARKNVEAAGFQQRVNFVEMNVLDPSGKFPAGADAVWMSQFLDCFALKEIQEITTRLASVLDPSVDVYVLEPLWDKQRYEAASYSLHATSLYFTAMANGNSKMYRMGELTAAVESGGFKLAEATHDLGANSYSLLRFRKA